MAVHMVSYDLNNLKNYEKLEKALERYPTRAKVLASQVLLHTDENVNQVREHLAKSLDKDDSLLVNEMTRQTVWQKVMISEENMVKWRNAMKLC